MKKLFLTLEYTADSLRTPSAGSLSFSDLVEPDTPGGSGTPVLEVEIPKRVRLYNKMVDPQAKQEEANTIADFFRLLGNLEGYHAWRREALRQGTN